MIRLARVIAAILRQLWLDDRAGFPLTPALEKISKELHIQ